MQEPSTLFGLKCWRKKSQDKSKWKPKKPTKTIQWLLRHMFHLTIPQTSPKIRCFTFTKNTENSPNLKQKTCAGRLPRPKKAVSKRALLGVTHGQPSGHVLSRPSVLNVAWLLPCSPKPKNPNSKTAPPKTKPTLNHASTIQTKAPMFASHPY